MMSWIQKLYETYDNCQSFIGVGSDEKEVPLLPICHTTQKAQIEIVLDQEGNFKRAKVVPEDEATTIIPCTESSGGRTSGKAPHPLCDKLQYVAADYKEYGGSKAYYYSSYKELLGKWCESEYKNSKVNAVKKYIDRGNVIEDLVDSKILITGPDGLLIEKWDKKAGENTPEIFKVTAKSGQMDAFVRWIVEVPNNPQDKVWSETNLFYSWINYYFSVKEGKLFCYVSGSVVPIADQHPKNIRRPGDGAKLISSGKTKNKDGTEKVNDPTGFTFRGRFLNSDQACSVGFEVSQKSHNALRWLISRQGYRRGDQAIVAWSTTGDRIPDPMADPHTILGFDEMISDSESSVSTAQELALKLKNKIAGYNAKLEHKTRIVVIGLDSATKGRMAITFYRELMGSDLLKRLEDWHSTCCWIHNYRQKEINDSTTGKKKKIRYKFVGAPAPNDIAEVVYGRRIDNNLRKSTVERILPCIIDGQKIPRDLVESSVRRASNRLAMEDYKDYWEWNKTLSIACALYRKYYEKEGYDMTLEYNRKTRDYLYGRLLALAESLEQWALSKAGENRQTTAARLMQRFADHPYTTWRTIELALGPYKARLGNKSLKRQKLISEVIAMFDSDDFLNDRKLSGEFLLGYHCQREALWKKEAEEEQIDNE